MRYVQVDLGDLVFGRKAAFVFYDRFFEFSFCFEAPAQVVVGEVIVRV